MNNPIGMCFPDFIGPSLLDCRFAQGPDGKIPEQSEDDFSVRPARRAALQQKIRQSNTFAA